MYFLFKVGSGAGSGSVPQNGSEDLEPYGNETDPEHWLNGSATMAKRIRNTG